MKRAPLIEIPGLLAKRGGRGALEQQLTREIRQHILDGLLRPGTRLPSSRELARSLRISRGTAMRSYEALCSEGYLESRTGQGTCVSTNLPEGFIQSKPRIKIQGLSTATDHLLLRRFKNLGAGVRAHWNGIHPFRSGVPPLDIFPLATWQRLTNAAQQRAGKEMLSYGNAAGSYDLRNAIAQHVAPGRGIHCEPDQVFIVSGSQQAIDLCARILLMPGEAVAFEEPGYRGARNIFRMNGARLIPIAVDSDGCGLPAATCPAKLLFVTPSHQYPLGCIMSLERRLELLEWAKKRRAIILEDDYSGEYRYRETPMPALKSLDRDGSVVYVGTMSKCLAPSLRVGYIIAPPPLLEVFSQALNIIESSVSTLTQVTLSAFIDQGFYARHLRQVRKTCLERRKALRSALERGLPNGCHVEEHDAGMHIVLHLPKDIPAQQLAEKLAAQSIQALPLSEFYLGPVKKNGILLHYAGFSEKRLSEGAFQLCGILRSWSSKEST